MSEFLHSHVDMKQSAVLIFGLFGSVTKIKWTAQLISSFFAELEEDKNLFGQLGFSILETN